MSRAAAIFSYYAARLELARSTCDDRGAAIWERNARSAAAVLIGRGC